MTLNGNDVAHLSDILDNGSNVVKFSEAHGTVKLNGLAKLAEQKMATTDMKVPIIRI